MSKQPASGGALAAELRLALVAALLVAAVFAMDALSPPATGLAEGEPGFSIMATSITNCTNITSPGDYQLDNDIINSSISNCINISANNVTLDCQGYTIDGNNTARFGIIANRSSSTNTNITIRNCTITDWKEAGVYAKFNANDSFQSLNTSRNNGSGIFLESGNNNTIQDCFADSNYGSFNSRVTASVELWASSGNVIRNCYIRNSTSGANTGIAILFSDYNLVANTRVIGTAGTGLYVNQATGNVIANSTVTNSSYRDLDIFTLSDSQCDNTYINVTGTDDKLIAYYNNTAVTLQGWDNNASEIVLCNADGSVLDNVTISHAGVRNNMIYLFRTDYANITNVNASRLFQGIVISRGSGHSITGSYFNDNLQQGITISSSDNVTITGSYANDNDYEGASIDSSNITVNSSHFDNDTYFGLEVSYSSNITIADSSMSNNQYYSSGTGLRLSHVANSTITGNTISGNRDVGVYVDSSADNLIYNNHFNNSDDFDFASTDANDWNTTLASGTNIIGGSSIGGNAWATPSEDGFSETCADGDSNGICDDQYNLTTNNIDYLPLVVPLNPNITDCRVLVRPGTYYMQNDIINSSTSSCIDIQSNNVTLDCLGNTIDGDESSFDGIFVSRGSEESTNITIRNCTLTDWLGEAIYIENADNNTLENLDVSSNTDSGIYLYFSSNNTLTGITADSNGGSGIYILASSDNNRLTDITADSNDDEGIRIDSSSDNTIEDSEASYNFEGIYLTSSSGNRITNVTAVANGNAGIDLIFSSSDNNITNATVNSNLNNGIEFYSGSDNNRLVNITADSNYNGIWVYSSSNNIVAKFSAQNNTNGIYLDSSSGTTLTDITAQNNTEWDFNSLSDSTDNIVINLTTWQNVLSFESKDVGLRGLQPSEAPADPSGHRNVSRWVNATNNSADSWLFLNMSYADEANESQLRIWRYNGSWSNTSFYAAGQYGVDTSRNIAFANITAFSIFGAFRVIPPAPPSPSFIPSPPAPPPPQPPTEPTFTVGQEPGSATVSISFLPAFEIATFSFWEAMTPLRELSLLASTNITNASLSYNSVDNVSAFESSPLSPVEVFFTGFAVDNTNLEGRIEEANMTIEVPKQWFDENRADPNSTVVRQFGKAGWETVPTYKVSETETTVRYTAVTNKLSFFAVAATSPPLQCGLCQAGDWSACADGEQTRLGNSCGPETGFRCVPAVERRACGMPMPTVPGVPFFELLIVPILALGAGVYLLVRK